MENGFDMIRKLRRIALDLLTRKYLILVILLLVFCAYFLPSLMLGNKVAVPDTLENCLRVKMQQFSREETSMDTFVHRSGGTAMLPPYVGNGVVAAMLNPEKGILIRGRRALELPVRFYPVVSVSIEGSEEVREATVMQLVKGLVHHVRCSRKGRSCITVQSTLYAHRTRPSILVQEVRITNPTEEPVQVQLNQIGASDWQNSQTETFRSPSQESDPVDCFVTWGRVPLADQTVLAAVASVRLPDGAEVKPSSSLALRVTTAVAYSDPVDERSHNSSETVSRLLKEVVSEAKTSLKASLQIASNQLRREHTDVWSSLWESGFSMSVSRAQNALNGDRINATMYLLLSNVANGQGLALAPDACYGGHSTMEADALWRRVDSEDDVAKLVASWSLTLANHGCSALLRTGVESFLQAVLLSMGALRFSTKHLELVRHPRDLHRDMSFRNVRLGNVTWLNISVEVGADNRAVLFTQLSRDDVPYFACDAGCLDAPLSLSRERSKIAVKLTEPLTPLLYITADQQHIAELKHAIHVREVVEAPAHEHHVIALHRHGHHLGGLPALFWFSIAFLVIVFHLFLVKLVVHEFCDSGANVRSEPLRYA